MRDGEPGSDDPFRPPDIPTEVHCLHCDEEYESYLIRWVPHRDADPTEGFWCCATQGCDGKGFCFDIWPTDPDWRDENGEKVWSYDDDSDDETEGEARENEGGLKELEDRKAPDIETNREADADWSPEWEQAMYGSTESDEPDEPAPPSPDTPRPPIPPFNEDDIPF
jgi:hypothetical protein